MIDTVILSTVSALHPPGQMAALQFTRACGHSGRHCDHNPRWRFNPPKIAGTLPRLTWTRAPDGEDYLSAAVSIPKLLFGSNVKMVETQKEIETALLCVSEYVSEVAQVSFQAGLANVGRVDFCHNWQLTPTEVCAYLHLVSQASLSRMRRDLIGGSSVYFSNQSQVVTLYAKLPEVLNRLQSGKATNEEVRSAVGFLRFETRYLNYRACSRLVKKLGLGSRRAEKLLTITVAEIVMKETLNDLGLDQSSQCGDVRLARLIDRYGPKRALALAGVLAACDVFGHNNLVQLGICKRSTLARMMKEIKDANAWLVSDHKEALRPLRIVRRRATTQNARVA